MSATDERHERDRHLNRLNDPTLFREFAYINGEWCAGEDGNGIDVTNPADGTWLGAVVSLTADQSRAAVEAADKAFAAWSMLLPQERSKVLRRGCNAARRMNRNRAVGDRGESSRHPL